jgi:hypothetical protein
LHSMPEPIAASVARLMMNSPPKSPSHSTLTQRPRSPKPSRESSAHLDSQPSIQTPARRVSVRSRLRVCGATTEVDHQAGAAADCVLSVNCTHHDDRYQGSCFPRPSTSLPVSIVEPSEPPSHSNGTSARPTGVCQAKTSLTISLSKVANARDCRTLSHPNSAAVCAKPVRPYGMTSDWLLVGVRVGRTRCLSSREPKPARLGFPLPSALPTPVTSVLQR